MTGDGKRYLFDNPRNVRLVVRALTWTCVLLLGLDFVVHRHLSHEWEGLFGFYALYGFVACVLLVLLAAEMRKLVMRDEDYYEREPEDTAAAPDAGDEDV
jgi:hypothetical protein